MKRTQTLLDLIPVTRLHRASLSTFYVRCPNCDSRIDAIPTGNNQTRSLAVCELCEMSFDYDDKDLQQSEDEPPDLDCSPTNSACTSAVERSFQSLIPQKADTMDPNQTFAEMFEAMRTDDHESVRQLALALKTWLSKGGFYPAGHTCEEIDTYLSSVLFRTSSPQDPQPPFSLVCLYCDAGQGIVSEEEALIEGWIEIEPAPQLLQANYLGVCPDCRGRHES